MIDREIKKELKQLQKKTGCRFRKTSYLVQALTHASYVNENPQQKLINNETLEFLGDAVLGLIITEYLYSEFPKYAEGKLSILKSMLVSEPALAELARKVDLGKYVFLGKGEDREQAKERPSLLSNTLEAMIGALYLDSGLKAAQKFIRRIYRHKFKEIPKIEVAGSFKNRLQQYTQTNLGCMPVYEVVAENGPPHKRLYEIEVKFNGETYGSGSGSSKKRAEQEAAKQALTKLGVK